MYLQQNPFYILDASTHDNRLRITELADERSLLLDSSEVTEARLKLITPRKRLSAEVAWLPGIEPKRAEEVLFLLKSSPMELLAVDDLPPIARANLLASGLALLPDLNADDVKEWILEISREYEKIVSEKLRDIINEERVVSGFPKVSDLSTVREAIEEQRRHYRQAIKLAIEKISHKELVKISTDAVESETNLGNEHGPSLIYDLIDTYKEKVQRDLDEGEENIKDLVERLRAEVDTKQSDSTIALRVNQLIQIVKNWDTVAQPIQLSTMSRGHKHDASHRVAHMVRDLAVHMWNEHGMRDFSQQFTNMLQEVFAEVVEVAEWAAKDANDLSIIEKESEIEELATQIKADADGGRPDSHLTTKVNHLCHLVKNWEIDVKHEASKRVAWIVRNLAIHMWNEHRMLDFSQQLTNMLQEVFAEVVEVAERISEDAEAYNKIEKLWEIEDITVQIKADVNGGRPDSHLAAKVNHLCQLVTNWEIDVEHETSKRAAWIVRDLATHMFKKHDELSQDLTATLLLVFKDTGDFRTFQERESRQRKLCFRFKKWLNF